MTTTTIGDIPVQGTITRSHRQAVEQKSLEELTPLIQAVLNDPTCAEFAWNQYTPYFNDGDPCEFGIHGVFAMPPINNDVEEYSDDRWDYEVYGRSKDGKFSPAVLALCEAVEGGAFDNVLLEHFGDHAEVALKADGFHVEFTEHD